MSSQLTSVQSAGASPAWPCEADFILSTLETAFSPDVDARQRGRGQFRVAAQLEIVGQRESGGAISVYTRDVSANGLGFIAREEIPAASKAILHVWSPSNSVIEIECTVYRCRPVASGWFEGAVAFSQPQDVLSAGANSPTTHFDERD